MEMLMPGGVWVEAAEVCFEGLGIVDERALAAKAAAAAEEQEAQARQKDQDRGARLMAERRAAEEAQVRRLGLRVPRTGSFGLEGHGFFVVRLP